MSNWGITRANGGGMFHAIWLSLKNSKPFQNTRTSYSDFAAAAQAETGSDQVSWRIGAGTGGGWETKRAGCIYSLLSPIIKNSTELNC
jgi:hypothetical protein